MTVTGPIAGLFAPKGDRSRSRELQGSKGRGEEQIELV